MARFWPAPGGGGGGGGPAVTVSATEPTSPSEGDLWYNSGTGETKVYVGEAFVAILPAHDNWGLTH
jgi:hypothetical protein